METHRFWSVGISQKNQIDGTFAKTDSIRSSVISECQYRSYAVIGVKQGPDGPRRPRRHIAKQRQSTQRGPRVSGWSTHIRVGMIQIRNRPVAANQMAFTCHPDRQSGGPLRVSRCMPIFFGKRDFDES
jgi:hypothetical protein